MWLSRKASFLNLLYFFLSSLVDRSAYCRLFCISQAPSSDVKPLHTSFAFIFCFRQMSCFLSRHNLPLFVFSSPLDKILLAIPVGWYAWMTLFLMGSLAVRECCTFPIPTRFHQFFTLHRCCFDEWACFDCYSIFWFLRKLIAGAIVLVLHLALSPVYGSRTRSLMG